MPLSPKRLARVVLVVAFTGAVLVGAGGPAAADCGSGEDQFGCDGSSGGPPGTGGPPTGTPGATGYYAWELDFVDKPGTLPTGEANGCWGVTTVGGPRSTPPPAGQSYQVATAEAATWANNGTLWGACPVEESFDIVAYVNQYWSAVVKPPPPSPLRIQPGRMLVAFTAYLEIGGDPNPSWSLANPIGPTITIRATPRYVITWGDGTSFETTSQGVPYPGGAGEITHAYRDEGSKTVTVRAYWRGEWSAGGDGGQLPELPVPTSSSLTLPVEAAEGVTD